MLSGIASYIWGPADGEEAGEEVQQQQGTADNVRLKLRDAEDDWELVDKSQRGRTPVRGILDSPSDQEEEEEMEMEEGGEGRGDPETVALLRLLPGCGSRLLLLPGGPGGRAGRAEDEAADPLSEAETVCSELSSIPEHVSYPSLEESWLVTPPPCFTAGGNSPQRLGTHPMENLLIEHPSMSVYGLRGGRGHSAGVDSEQSESSTEGGAPHLTRAAARRAAAAGTSRRVAHPPHRPRAVAARAGLASPAHTVRSMQKSAKRAESHRLSKAHMQRANQATVRSGNGRQQHQYYLRHSGRNNDRKICY